jgi:hypothetical protein
MNVTSLIASASLLIIAGAAMADSGKTRAEVVAELNQARAAGQLDQSEAALDRVDAGARSVSRAQVRAEVLAARAAGTLDRSEATESVAYVAPRQNGADSHMAAKAGGSATQQH